jgi:hypothetical protein
VSRDFTSVRALHKDGRDAMFGFSRIWICRLARVDARDSGPRGEVPRAEELSEVVGQLRKNGADRVPADPRMVMSWLMKPSRPADISRIFAF